MCELYGEINQTLSLGVVIYNLYIYIYMTEWKESLEVKKKL
jgi:hypothetical protein